MVLAVDLVVPGAAVPVVVAREGEDAGALDVERHVELVGFLVEEVAGVGGLVAALAVVGAAHIGAGADPLQRPLVPATVGVEADRDHGRLGFSAARGLGGTAAQGDEGDEGGGAFHFFGSQESLQIWMPFRLGRRNAM